MLLLAILAGVINKDSVPACEVRGHRNEPFADRGIERELILQSEALPFVSGSGQRAQLVVPDHTALLQLLASLPVKLESA